MALFSYLDEAYDEETPYKLDVIALCCEFSEYKNLTEYLKDYSNQHSTIEEVKNLNETKDFKEVIEEEISEKTSLIKFNEDINEGFIIQQF